MRLITLAAAAGVAAFALSVSAQTADDPASAPYLAELFRQCPQSRLELLTPAQLRDGLDDFVAGQPQPVQDHMRQAESARCAAGGQGAACVNDADLAAAEEGGLTSDVAASICGAYLRCRGPGDCDATR